MKKSVIIVRNGGAEEAVQGYFKALESAQGIEIILIDKVRPSFPTPPYKFIPTGNSSIASCLSLAMSMSTGDTTLFVDGRSTFTSGTLADVVRAMEQGSGVTYCAEQNGEYHAELPEQLPEGLLHTLTEGETIPTACVAVRTSGLNHLEISNAQSYEEFVARIIIMAIGAAESVERTDATVQMVVGAQMSAEVRARCLKNLVSASNIEELFPTHDWHVHQKESAAAAYHSLAALFIKLEDSESALECLKLSDQLEDSPRSLALKGLIALDKGEILGAVANMVSSLQQYELRKKENDAHYARFQPDNLELINDNLNAGLAALNRRDNTRALNHFAEAVFHFDSFYSQLGVARLKAA